MRNWVKLALGLCGVAFLVAHPITRMIIFFILPLGSGWDDFLVAVPLGIALILVVLHWHDIWERFSEWIAS